MCGRGADGVWRMGRMEGLQPDELEKLRVRGRNRCGRWAGEGCWWRMEDVGTVCLTAGSACAAHHDTLPTTSTPAARCHRHFLPRPAVLSCRALQLRSSAPLLTHPGLPPCSISECLSLPLPPRPPAQAGLGRVLPPRLEPRHPQALPPPLPRRRRRAAAGGALWGDQAGGAGGERRGRGLLAARGAPRRQQVPRGPRLRGCRGTQSGLGRNCIGSWPSPSPPGAYPMTAP